MAKADHGYDSQRRLWKRFRRKLRVIIPSAMRDCSTYKFQCTSFLKFESHNKASKIISKTVPFWGSYFHVAVKIPLFGKTVGPTNKLIGRILPKLSFLGFRKEASFENAVWNYEIFLKLIGAQYDVETAFPQSRPFTIHKCPAGHCRLEHLDACMATMELNHSLVESSGARLAVDKRSPLDGICIERVVRK